MIATMLGLVIVKIDSVKGLAMAERWVLYLVLCVDLLCWQYMLREFAKLFRILRAE